MSDQSTVDAPTTEPDDNQDGNGQEVDPSAAISRGVGLSLEAVKAKSPDDPVRQAWDAFVEFCEGFEASKQAFKDLELERMRRVYDMKATHGVGFSALAEPLKATSSLALYLYERAQGKSAKQIREESVASNLAKQATRTSDPDRKPARKQTPEEKALRKRQREELRAFLEEQAKAAAERGETDDEVQADLVDLDAQDAADSDDDT